MAEAIAIIGLASSIATFIDLGLGVVKTGRAVFNSARGTTDEAYELGLILEDVDARLNEVLVFMRSGRHPRQQRGHDTALQRAREERERYEKNLQSIAAECKRLAKGLQDILNSLAVKKNARFPRLEAGKVTMKSFLKKDDIETLRGRLERLETRLRIHVSETVEELRYIQLLEELHTLKASHEQHSINNPKLDTLQQDLARLTRDQKAGSVALSANLTSLSTKFATFQQDRGLWESQLQTVKSLYFTELRRREFDIMDAHAKTESWLYVRNRTTFLKWLEKGSGIYWIQGLAGSGKSTLMKFVCHHPQTLQCLDVWAGDSSIYTADFFFWYQGHNMQKSLHGLIQSLVYQILRKAPQLVTELGCDHVDHEAWEFAELKRLLRRLLAYTSLSAKFCFFIDGLDEYNGDVDDIIEVLQSFAKSKHIKICASSRPWPAFEEAFARLASQDPSYENIVTEVAARARGVWLWVFLVSRDLKAALNSKEEYQVLEKILNSFPPDLSSYFEAIVKRIGPAYREEMAQILLVAVGAVSSLPLYAFDFMRTKWYDPVEVVTRSEVESSYVGWKNKLHNRCGDLVVIRKYEDCGPLFSYRLEFLHRTVRDWLRDNKFTSLRTEIQDPTFNHWMTLCRMTLGLMKALPAAPRSPIRGLNKSYTVLEMSGLVDNLLYYAHEFEKSSEANHDVVTQILDRADWVTNNYVSLQEDDSLDVLRLPVCVKRRGLGGKCNFLALAVEAQLVNYVRLKLEISPESITKSGRPLLDWATSPRRITPASFLGHGDGGPEGVDARMVALLLEKGASPADRQALYHPTVWDNFLQACYGAATETEPGFDGIRGSWLQVTRLLIEHGAGDEPAFRNHQGQLTRPSTLRETFDTVFGPDETQRLLARIATIQERQSGDHWAWVAWKQLHKYLPTTWAYH